MPTLRAIEAILRSNVDRAIQTYDEAMRPCWSFDVMTGKFADSEGWRSAFRTDVDHHSEVMPIGVPNRSRSVLRLQFGIVIGMGLESPMVPAPSMRLLLVNALPEPKMHVVDAMVSLPEPVKVEAGARRHPSGK